MTDNTQDMKMPFCIDIMRIDERQQKLWVLGLQYTTNGVVKMPEALFGD